MTETTALDITDVLIQGDLSKLTPEQKLRYYLRVCESLKLNPYTKPFGYIRFRDGGEQLYALKNCTDQLRDIHKVSIVSLERQRDADLITVIASAKLPDGRTDFALGAVPIFKGLAGEALANAMMKAETKAKRRLTLAICGLGWTDESEVDSIAGAEVYEVPSLPEPAERYVPTRERDVAEARPPRPQYQTITSGDDRLWKRWEDVRSEALRYGVVPPNLSLPIGYDQLISNATMVKAQTEAKLAQLAREEAARAAGREREGTPPSGEADADPPAAQSGPAAPSSPPDPWVDNRVLMAQAFDAGYKLRDLPAATPPDEVEIRNGEIRQLLEK